MTTIDYSTHQIAPAPYAVEGVGFETFSTTKMYATAALFPIVIQLIVGLPYYWYLPFLIVLAVPSFAAFQFVASRNNSPLRPQKGLPGKKLEHYLTIKSDAYRNYSGYSKIPIETFFEAYFDEDIDINGDMLETLEARYDWAAFVFTLRHAKFFLTQWVPETLWHSRKQDEDQVREHYDRGDDFYNWFCKFFYFLLNLEQFLSFSGSYDDLYFWYYVV
jgi:hypothetical protein